MTNIPVISSIISPEYLSGLITEKYGFSDEVTCAVFRIGVNHTYFIFDGTKKYVLRIYAFNWRTEEEIAEELDLLNLFKRNGVFVSYPIKDVNENYIQYLNANEGERFAVLFSYANGETIRNPSEKACYSLGQAMAKMHKVTNGKSIRRNTYDSESLVGWAFQLAKERFAKTLPEMQFIKRAHSVISNQFKDADSSQLRTGVVHLDLWYDNMKIEDEQKITMFDFDNCGNGWLFLDIAYSLMLLFKNEPNKNEYEKKALSFFKGYESVCRISKEEKRLIPFGGLAIWIHYTGIHCLRFNDFSNLFLNDEFLVYWISTVRNWMEYHKIEI